MRRKTLTCKILLYVQYEGPIDENGLAGNSKLPSDLVMGDHLCGLSQKVGTRLVVSFVFSTKSL